MAYSQFREVKIPEHLLNVRHKMPETVPGKEGGHFIQEIVPGQKLLMDETVGTTWYDLQSYDAVQNRIYAFEDGTVGVTYMRANDVGTWNERGSAYNYFDGSSWGPNPSGRIETVRTGWPCYAPYGPGGEIVVSHSVIQSMGLIFNKREVKGEGAWEEFYLQGPTGYDIVWPAMVTNGPDHMNIHILAVTYGDPYEGMTSALLYYRSTDGGETWNIQHWLMDELNSNYFNGIGGDNYTWAEPRGDTLAFSVGFDTQDGYVMKSYDNGDNWTQIVVYDSPYTPYTGEATPTYCAGDGTQACALDSQGNVHVVFGRMWHYFDDAGTGYYYPTTEGIVYWNESMPVLDTTIMSTISLEYLIEGGNLIGWIPPNQGDSTIIGYGIYYVSLTSHPQINIDENDNIYVVWAAPAPGYDNMDMNYRHIFANGSTDGGQTWSGIKDLTTDLMYIFSECMYPVMSPSFVNDQVYLTFLADGLPGIHIWTGGHDPVENWLMFQQREIDDFLVGFEEHGINGFEPKLEVYPNPFSTSFYLKTGLSGTGTKGNINYTVQVFDVTGRQLTEMESNPEILEIDGSAWNPGIYVLSVRAGNIVETARIIKR